MSFLYPVFLLALLALAIPVIIHFFNFKRYKTVYFSNVSLLRLVRKESKKKSVLKQILILVSRILALAALIIAFSRPYIPINGSSRHTASQTVAIFIDNSFSMKATGENGQLLEQAKLKAIEIANSYRSATQFRLISCDLLPQHQFFMNKDQFIQEVAKLTESPRTVQFSAIYEEVARSFSKQPSKVEKTLYLLSDFQKISFDPESFQPDSSLFTYFLNFKADESSNLLVDSCWFDVPGRKIGQQETLYVRIKNLSSQAFQHIPVRLTMNDTLKSMANITIAGNEELVIELNYTNNSPGIQLGKVELDDYPIIYDNAWYFSYLVKGKLNALGITSGQPGGSKYLNALFEDDEFVNYTEFSENSLQISQIKNSDCIFLVNNQKLSSGLANELNEWVREGGSLAVFPGKLSDYTDLNKLLGMLGSKLISTFDTAKIGISEINYQNDLYRNVFKNQEKITTFPEINGTVRFNDQALNPETSILKFRNQKDALTALTSGNGLVYVFSFPLHAQNISFVQHPVFVPTLYNMVLNSGGVQQYSYTIGQSGTVLLNKDSRFSGEISLKNTQEDEEFLTQVRTLGNGRKQISIENLSITAGHYLLNDENTALQSLSFNYSRKESSPECYSTEELKKLTQRSGFENFQLIADTGSGFSETLQDLTNGKQLWKLFIAFAILFLAIEMAIIRFWK